MSLDVFRAGPNVREAEPMGDGGERLLAWMVGRRQNTGTAISASATTSELTRQSNRRTRTMSSTKPPFHTTYED